MKDLDRIRERGDRERRSPSILGAMLLVAFGGVFAFGLWVGQRRAETHRPRVEDPLARLDAQSPRESMVFHDALAVPSPPSSDVNAAIAPAVRVAAPSVRVVNPMVQPMVQPMVLPAEPQTDPADLRDAPSLRPPPAPEAPSAPAGEEGVFTLHVASYATLAEAENFRDRMRKAGHRAFVVRAFVPERASDLYRIRVGPFDTLAQAQRYRLDFEQTMSLPSFIVRRETPEERAVRREAERRAPPRNPQST